MYALFGAMKVPYFKGFSVKSGVSFTSTHIGIIRCSCSVALIFKYFKLVLSQFVHRIEFCSQTDLMR